MQREICLDCGWQSRDHPDDEMFAVIGFGRSCPACKEAERNDKGLNVYGSLVRKNIKTPPHDIPSLEKLPITDVERILLEERIQKATIQDFRVHGRIYYFDKLHGRFVSNMVATMRYFYRKGWHLAAYYFPSDGEEGIFIGAGSKLVKLLAELLMRQQVEDHNTDAIDYDWRLERNG